MGLRDQDRYYCSCNFFLKFLTKSAQQYVRKPVLNNNFRRIYFFEVVQQPHSLFCFLDRVFSIMKTKINQQNAQINSGLIYYWSITPTCFDPSVEAIIREFEILRELQSHCIDLLECCYVYMFASWCDWSVIN